MSNLHRVLGPLLAVLLSALPLCSQAEFIDVLDLPARVSALAQSSPLTDVSRAGDSLVAVGQRGHILYSDDSGQHWQQASVPVSSDLNAVYFVTARLGWAVGHDGVILRSDDGGASWNKQLDGRQIGPLMLEHYSARAAADPQNEEWQLRQADAQRMVEEGASQALLDIWFENARVGYAVGVFGLILRTDDGGQRWQPFAEHTDNPQSLHLNAIVAVDGVPHIVGEQGLLLHWSFAQRRFSALSTPYAGSYFGLGGGHGELWLYGLRGHVLRSADGGSHWQMLDSGLQVNFIAASQDQAGRFYLFSQAGHLLRALAGGQLETLPQSQLSPVSAATFAADGALVLVGARGVRTLRVE